MTNYEIARLGDAHCHLSTSLTLEASKAVVELVNKQYQLPSRFFKVMSTNHLDVHILDDMMDHLKSPVFQGFFGIHPWYTHLFTTLSDTNTETLKEIHYNEILSPAPSPELLAVLPIPIDLHKHSKAIQSLLHKHPGSGIGEIGLDKMFRIPSNGYYGNQDSNNSEVKLSACRVKIDHQVAILRVMLQLANDLQRPVSLHCVKAHGPLFDIVREYHQIPQVILHSFSGSVDQGRRWVAEYRKRDQDLGFSFSHYINGVEDKRSQLNELVGYLDDSQILIETDISIDKHLERDYTDHLFGIAETIRVSRGWDLERFYAIIKQNLYKHTH